RHTRFSRDWSSDVCSSDLHAALLRENVRLRDEVERLAADTELLGNSPAMQHVRDFILRAAPTNATILITGDTGTGKELVARAIQIGRASCRERRQSCVASA